MQGMNSYRFGNRYFYFRLSTLAFFAGLGGAVALYEWAIAGLGWEGTDIADWGAGVVMFAGGWAGLWALSWIEDRDRPPPPERTRRDIAQTESIMGEWDQRYLQSLENKKATHPPELSKLDSP